MSLVNILKPFEFSNSNKTGLIRYLYEFSVDYDDIDINNNVDITNILKMI